ncbi:MAG: elongation factor 4 [Armatimonadetes bacterium]|nr:elongation factor 4 [Armatimonadota bacterium]
MTEKIRNFCIIAHIDHGKSTLADRLLELTGTIDPSKMVNQVLDKMDLERERGITIKSSPVRIHYKSKDGEDYILNLIDTPGHVDFTYEVSRSLVACEGALLVIDASQGIEAQTLANFYLAKELNLKIIPVINKIDLPAADPEKIKKDIKELLDINPEEVLLISAKSGIGVEDVLEAVIHRIPPPAGRNNEPLKALIFDSYYNNYKGVVVVFRVMQGEINVGDTIKFFSNNKTFEVNELGFLTPDMTPASRLSTGEVGYLTAQIKNIKDTTMGDTVTLSKNPASEPLAGYKEIKPMVFCGLYPTENKNYTLLREALGKLKLNDASFTFEGETSNALGYGFRCGFLGLLHMEIIQERLEREFGIELIATAPNVIYHIHKKDGSVIEIDNPSKFPSALEIIAAREPFVKAALLTPAQFIGPVMELCQKKRGEFEKIEYLSNERSIIHTLLPLSEIIIDFFDLLKSKTKGYASLDYDFFGYKESKLLKMEILLNGKPVDALSCIVHGENAQELAQKIVSRLKEVIPRQQYELPVQAALGAKIIARETIKAFRKDVTKKCYGGDITRKRKLLENQKKGKKRMKSIGNIQIPQEAFLYAVKM